MFPRVKSKFARYRLRVARSGIHRFGVYTLEEIPARRVVVEYTGKRLTGGQASRISPEKDIYLADLTKGVSVVDGGVGGSGAQFANHSCNPNMMKKVIRDRLFFVSLRNIRIGEELTWSYGYPHKLRRVPCRCGSRNCRGTLRLILT